MKKKFAVFIIGAFFILPLTAILVYIVIQTGKGYNTVFNDRVETTAKVIDVSYERGGANAPRIEYMLNGENYIHQIKNHTILKRFYEGDEIQIRVSLKNPQKVFYSDPIIFLSLPFALCLGIGLFNLAMAYLAARILNAPAQMFFLKMIFAVVFIMGLAFIYMSHIRWEERKLFLDKSIEVEGKRIDYKKEVCTTLKKEDDDGYREKVEYDCYSSIYTYTTLEGVTYQFTDSGKSGHKPKIGETVAILYRKGNPVDGRLKRKIQNKYRIIMVAVIGLMMIVIGGFGVSGRKM